jgi:hypothetical protein
VTDAEIDGKPLVGLGFNSIGRFAQGGLLRERFIPRLEDAAPQDLLAADGALFDEPVARHARAAVTPFGKRLFRNISHAFLVKREKGRSVIAREQAARGGAAADAGPGTTFYRPMPNLRGHFVTEEKVLVPYFGYGVDTGAKKEPGISINWEGELSTGGYIADFGPGSSALHQFMTGRHESVALEQMTQHQVAGITYHNHNELHHILAALVRAQDFLNRLRVYHIKDVAPPAENGEEADEGQDEKEKEERLDPWAQLRGVVAYWRKGTAIDGGETGYMLHDGVHRLVVQNTPEDPDERDIGLILRGYGAAVRQRLFQAARERSADEAAQPPSYRYYERTSLEEAWAQGFAIFFAAAVLGPGRVRNEFAVEDRERRRRSVDLDLIFRQAGQARGKRLYDERFRRVRGADNAVAVAAGLWRAAQALSPEYVLARILADDGADLGRFLNFVTRDKPALLQDMAALGLCPRVDRWPPAASIKAGVSPDAMHIFWHPNDMVEDARQIGATLVFGPASADEPARLPLRAPGKGGKRPVTYPYGLLRDGKAGEEVLKRPLRNGEKCFWTVETTFGEEEHVFRWPLQDFVAETPTHNVSDGRTLYARNGTAQFPPGAADQAQLGNRTIHSILGGRRVLGGAVYQLIIEDAEQTEQFRKPVTLTLSWDADEDPGDATAGIYYLNAEDDLWELVSTERVGERDVQATVTRAGSYALMVDRQPPSVTDLVDYPDPFPARADDAVWHLEGTLSEPAAVTLQIENAEGKVVRSLLKDQAQPVGPLTVTWDGKNGAGAAVPDGVYTYRLVARDESGLAAEPITGPVTVFSGPLGSARGKVTLAAPEAGGPSVELLGTSLSAECEADGSFWFIGLPRGQHELRFAAPGHFEETAQVELKEDGGTVAVPETALTNVALEKLRTSSEVFTPDGDGERDYVAVQFAMLRACPLEAHVYGEGKTPLATLQERKNMAAGESVLLWHGLDHDGRPLPSGWYTIRLVAHSRTEPIPQGEVKVLLDRGLVRNAHAFPYTVSPNDDGFEDVLEIGYTLEADARVTVRVLAHDGKLLKELAADAERRKGWNAVTWDLKGGDGKPLADGRYAFEVAPKYPSGHASKIVRGDFLCDSRPPEIGDVEPANGAIVETGMPTVRARVLSDRSDLDPGQLRIKIDELTVKPDGYDPGTGWFEFTPKTSLGEGTHIAIAYAQDWAGNYAPPQAVSFEVVLKAPDQEAFIDREKPVVLDLQPAKDETVYTATPLITGRVRDTGSGVDPNHILIHINGEQVSNAVRKFIPGTSGEAWDWYSYEKAIVLFDPLQGEVRYVPLQRLEAGKNHVTLEVRDRAGNGSKPVERVFNVVLDDAPPTVALIEPRPGATLARPELVIRAKLADPGESGLALDTLRVAIDGRAVDPGDAMTFDAETGQLIVPLQERLSRNAQHAVLVTVRDRAGNVSPPAVSVFNIVEDGEAPRIDVLTPASDRPAPADGTVLFAAAVYDLGRSGVDPDTLRLAVDEKPVPPDDPDTPAIDGYRYKDGLLTHRLEGLAAGPHVISLGVRDGAGNAAQPVAWRFEVK